MSVLEDITKFLKDLWWLIAFVVAVIVAIVRQWDRVNHNKDKIREANKKIDNEIEKVNKEIKHLPELMGKWKDEVIKQNQETRDLVHEMKGKLDTIHYLIKNSK